MVSVVIFCRVLQNHDDEGHEYMWRKSPKSPQKLIHTINISGLVFLTHKFDSAVSWAKGVTRGKCFTNYLQLCARSTNHPPSVTNVASMCQIRDKLFTCLTIQLSSFPDTVWQTQHTFPSRSSPHNIKNFSTHRKFFLIKHWHLTGFKDCCTNNCSYIWSHQCLFWNNTENANI